ncbi:hypothetical protein HDU96_010350 [Phlyctochytrium bullatum]|nr:hypothetical protein HDU96_010350 [Phlyctochytrium bullatum]
MPKLGDLVRLSTWYRQYEFAKLLREKQLVIPELLYKPDDILNSKVAIWQGDITTLELDALVTAANSRLAGGGGVDGAIHRAAGRELLEECLTLGGCPTGGAKITKAYKLPSKAVIHAVGPVGLKPDPLKSAYISSLNLCKDNSLKTVAFPCISTGIYGYPQEDAAHVALLAVREWLLQNLDVMDLVVFCIFMPKDLEIYQRLAPIYFPPTELHGAKAKTQQEPSEKTS